MGTLLKSTCHTFLKTLEECMQIANAAFTSELLYRTPPGSPQLAVLKPSKVRGRHWWEGVHLNWPQKAMKELANSILNGILSYGAQHPL